MATTSEYKRGNIYHVAYGQVNSVGDEIWSDRPAIIISNDVSNKHSGVVTIVYLTTSKKKRLRPTHVPILSGESQALAMCEQIFSVDKTRIKEYIGTITDEEMANIESALLFQFCINPVSRPATIFKKWENYIVRNNMNIDKYNVPECITSETNKDTTEQETISNKAYIDILREEIRILNDEVDKYKQLYGNCKKIISQ